MISGIHLVTLGGANRTPHNLGIGRMEAASGIGMGYTGHAGFIVAMVIYAEGFASVAVDGDSHDQAFFKERDNIQRYNPTTTKDINVVIEPKA